MKQLTRKDSSGSTVMVPGVGKVAPGETIEVEDAELAAALIEGGRFEASSTTRTRKKQPATKPAEE